jgi:hypothetical protein
MARCAAIKRNGERCKVEAMPDAQWCWSHDPDHAEERRRRASKGGKRGGRGRPYAELAEVKQLIRGLVEDVMEGKRDRADAAVCGQLLNVQLRAIATELQVKEQTELIERLEELEALEEARKQREGRRYGA